METTLYRVTPAGVDECVCRLDGDSLVMEIRRAGRAPRVTRQAYEDAAWQFPQLLGRKLGEGYVELADGERAAVGDVVFRASSRGPYFDLHPNGTSIVYAERLASGGVDVYLLELASGASRRLYVLEPDRDSNTSVHALRWTPDGTQVLLALPGGIVRIDMTGNVAGVVRFRGLDLRPAMDLAAGNVLGSLFREVIVLALADVEGEPIFKQAVADPSHVRAALSRDGREVAIASSEEARIVIYDVASGREVQRVAAPGPVWRVGFSPDGARLLVSVDWHRTGPVVLDRASGRELHRFVAEGDRLRETPAWTWSPDGTTLALAGDRLTLLDASTFAVRPESAWIDDSASHVAYSADGGLIAYSGPSLTVRRASATPNALRVPRPRPPVVAEESPIGFDANELLAEWDGLAAQGTFPCGDLYFRDKVQMWDARLEVFARRTDDGDRYWIVWQVIGDDGPGCRPLATHLIAVGDRFDWPRQEMAGKSELEIEGQYRITTDYALDDEAAREEDVEYHEEPQDPDGPWARLHGFRVTVDGVAHELAPSRNDYTAAGIALTSEQWARNPTAAETTIARITAHLLRDQLWYPTPLALAGLAGEAAAAFVCVHREHGVDVMDEVNAGTLPRQSTRWPAIARVLAQGPDAWQAAARDAATAATATPLDASAAAMRQAIRTKHFPELDREPTPAECAEVWFLDLTDNLAITDLSPLAAFPRLRRLHLFRTGVNDLGPLAQLADLEELNLAEVALDDLSPLAHCRALRNLTLSKTRIADLSPLAGLDRLESLDIESTDVDDLKPLRRHTQLRELFLDNSDVTSLEPLRGFTQLRRVFMRRTRITDVSPLAASKHLMVLALPTSVTDLEPLRELPVYEELIAKRKPTDS